MYKTITTKEELKEFCMDNQPYYKKHIPEVVNYFAKKYNINYKEEKEFLINREGWMFNEMFYSNFIFINNTNKS